MLNNPPTTEEQDDAFLIEVFASFASMKVQEYESRQGPPITNLQLNFNDEGDVPTGFQDGGLTSLQNLTIGEIIDPQNETPGSDSPGYDPKKVFTEAMDDPSGDPAIGIDTGSNTFSGTLSGIAAAIGAVATHAGVTPALAGVLGLNNPAMPSIKAAYTASLQDYYATEEEATEAFAARSDITADDAISVTAENQAMDDIAMDDAISVDAADGIGGVSAGSSAGSGDPGGVGTGSGTGVGVGDAWKHGGQIKGYREGDLVGEDQADTQLDDLGLGPIGMVNDPDGTTGVADDLDMELSLGSYVLNEEVGKREGLVSINEIIKEAIDLALEDGVDLPVEIKTSEKIPIRISRGEIVIPAPLVDYIGLRKLENMNNRGLKARKQREAEEAPVETAAAPSPQEDLLAQLQTVA